MEVGCEDVGILIDCPILYHGLLSLKDIENLLISVVKKVNLQVEGPSLHVMIEILQIGVVFRAFEMGFPLEVPGQLSTQGGLAGTDIARNGYVFDFVCIHSDSFV
jgi:hypothetical protein